MEEPSFNEPVISGPFELCGGSLTVEFLKPHPSRNASVLWRGTFHHDHPLCKKGRSHPVSPPLHLHFSQTETCHVLSGKLGTTGTYNLKDQVLTAVDGPHEIPPWLPHTFWPAPSSTEDTVFLLWAHPDNVHQAMDRIFFTNLLLYFSDIHEKRVSLNPFQIMLMQHNSSTTSVWFPTVTWLGPLRWWVPWVVQASFAAVGRLAGMAPVMEKYTSKEDWEMIRNAKDG